MTALRIAYVIGTTAGGTGRHAAMLARGCAARGLTVTAFGPAATRNLFPAAAFCPVEIADRPRPARDAVAMLRLRRGFTRCRPDVVHAHGLRAGAATVLALAGPARGHRPAVQVTMHNAAPSGMLSGAVYAALERLVARRADSVLCVSADLAGRMRRAGATSVALAAVPAPAVPAPSAEAAAKARAELGALGTHVSRETQVSRAAPVAQERPVRPVVLAAGRLVPQKGFDVLLEALIGLRDRHPRPLLAIAGDGPMRGPLAARSREAGLDVRFLGHRADVPTLLGAADLVVVPSRWEGQPLVVQEALRAGRPLVASRVGGVPGLTGEDGALLVAPDDPAGLAAAIASVLDDPVLASRLGAAALARARTLPTESDAVDAVSAGYARLAGGPRCGSG